MSRSGVARRLQPLSGGDEWQERRPRDLGPAELRRLEGLLADVLEALGLPRHARGTVGTPRRLLEALVDATEGYEGDPRAVTLFPAERRHAAGSADQVVEGPIRFYALCEHHALPFHGVAHVGYVPGPAIIGISKLTRIVRLFARRFTVQERIGDRVAAALAAVLEPRGVAVSLSAVHACTQMRGVRETEGTTRTLTWRGAYEANPELRSEFLELVGDENA